MKIKQFLKAEYEIMTYHKFCNVKAEHDYTYVSPHKISTKSMVRKLPLWNDIHYNTFFFILSMNDVSWVEADSFESWRG